MASKAASEAMQEKNVAGEYTAANVQVLEALDDVRTRPGMYIGCTGPRGLHHLVYEILDNAVDEAQAGHATNINVVLHDDNSVSVTDNGRGDKDISLSGEHVREGMTCIIAVKVPNPEFEGQTKTRLGNPEVRRIVEQSVQENLTEYLELHPDVLDSILSKSLNALKAALAAKRARELVRTKSVLKSSSLPEKLADCASTNPEESEIFIVEGNSAGGSAKQGRDRKFQAILPLRGKILSIGRKDEAALYKSEEIQNLILALGLGVKGEDFKKEALRYHKIVIFTDADVDGAHIRTLLLSSLDIREHYSMKVASMLVYLLFTRLSAGNKCTTAMMMLILKS